MQLFGNDPKILIQQENRLTKIESTISEIHQLVMAGLLIMLIGAYLMVKLPIDALTTRVDKQNGRVTSLEWKFQSHEQQSVDKNLYGRIEEIEEWKENREKKIWTQDGILLGKAQIIAIVFTILLGLGSAVWAIFQIIEKILL